MIKGLKDYINRDFRFERSQTIRVGAILFFLALSVRLAYTAWHFHRFGTSNFADDWEYLSYADNIINQGLWVPRIDLIINYGHQIGIGFPLMIASLKGLFGESLWPIFIFNCVCGALTCVAIFFFANHFFNPLTGLLASVWSIFYPKFLKFGPFVLKENLLQLLFPLSIFSAFYLARKPKLDWWTMVPILLFSILIHSDERYSVYLPVMFLIIWLFDDHSRKKGFAKASIFVAGVGLLMIPWSVRNYKVYERPVILSIRTAKFTDALMDYQGRKPEEEYRKLKLSSYSRKNLPLYEALADSIKNGKKVRSRNVKFLEDIEKAIHSGIDVRTYSPAKGYWEEFKELWRPFRFEHGMVANGYRYQPAWPVVNNLVYIGSFGVLLPLLVFSFLVRGQSTSRFRQVFWAVAIIHTVLHVFAIHARQRYRIPIDPFIIMLAMWTIQQMLLPTTRVVQDD